MFEAKNISVCLGRKKIIHNIDFCAQPGELTVIVGPNGSGKTTLMRTLCGDIAYTGSVFLDNNDVKTLKPWQMASRRAVLPQSSSLNFPFTVREIVSLGLTGGFSGVSPAEEQLLPERALAMVDLDGFSGRLYQELSGGEQQRVQLARVLCQIWVPVVEKQQRYLFLDEPVSSLDIKHQLTVMEIAKKFARDGGGVIAILHDLNLTAIYADKVYMMHQGKIAGVGRPAELFTSAELSKVYDCDLRVSETPASGIPFVLPFRHCAV